MVTRRQFLTYGGTGLLLAGAPMATSCGAARRDDLSPPGQWKEPVLGLERDEMEILYLASLAPSGHNLQPWTVKVVGPKHWIIGSDKSLRLPEVDPGNRELILTLGAFLENLVVAARTFGYEPEIKIPAANSKEAEIADIRLRKEKPVDFPLDKIKKRRTVRNGFSGEEIRAEDLRYVTRHDEESCVLSKVPSPHAFYFSNGSQSGKVLQEGVIEANRTQAFRDSAQEELARWIRWSVKRWNRPLWVKTTVSSWSEVSLKWKTSRMVTRSPWEVWNRSPVASKAPSRE